MDVRRPQLTFYVDHSDMDVLRAISHATGVSSSAYMRAFLAAGLYREPLPEWARVHRWARDLRAEIRSEGT